MEWQGDPYFDQIKMLPNTRFSDTVSLSANIKGDVCPPILLPQKNWDNVCIILCFLSRKFLSYQILQVGLCGDSDISCYNFVRKLLSLSCDFTAVGLFVVIKGKVSSNTSCHKQTRPGDIFMTLWQSWGRNSLSISSGYERKSVVSAVIQHWRH